MAHAGRLDWISDRTNGGCRQVRQVSCQAAGQHEVKLWDDERLRTQFAAQAPPWPQTSRAFEARLLPVEEPLLPCCSKSGFYYRPPESSSDWGEPQTDRLSYLRQSCVFEVVVVIV